MTIVDGKMDAGPEPLKVSVGDSEKALFGVWGVWGHGDLKVRKSASVKDCSWEKNACV